MQCFLLLLFVQSCRALYEMTNCKSSRAIPPQSFLSSDVGLIGSMTFGVIICQGKRVFISLISPMITHRTVVFIIRTYAIWERNTSVLAYLCLVLVVRLVLDSRIIYYLRFDSTSRQQSWLVLSSSTSPTYLQFVSKARYLELFVC